MTEYEKEKWREVLWALVALALISSAVLSLVFLLMGDSA